MALDLEVYADSVLLIPKYMLLFMSPNSTVYLLSVIRDYLFWRHPNIHLEMIYSE